MALSSTRRMRGLKYSPFSVGAGDVGLDVGVMMYGMEDGRGGEGMLGVFLVTAWSSGTLSLSLLLR